MATIDTAQDYADSRRILLADGEHSPSLSLTAMVQRLITQRDRARQTPGVFPAVEIAAPAVADAEATDEAPEARWDWTGVPMPERLRMVASWLCEDSELDDDDARAIADVLDKAAAELEG